MLSEVVQIAVKVQQALSAGAMGLVDGAGSVASTVPSEAIDRVRQLGEDVARLAARQKELEQIVTNAQPQADRWSIFNGYIGVFVVAFLVTLICTPIMRRLAIANNIIDRPNEARKAHKLPVAYLGGVAVYLGLVAAIGFSYAANYHGLMTYHKTVHLTHDGGVNFPVPMSVLVGLTVIMLIGLLDDVINVTPSQKIGGMLIASAALAYQDVGVKVASQVLTGAGAIFSEKLGMPAGWIIDYPLGFEIPLVGSSLHLDIIYWTGTAVIAIFVLGACNALNLIDGLDGLCSGITAIAGSALLIMALTLALYDDGPLDGARIILCLAMVGACLGFLPHNYNPASIFLGDAGSLMLGYLTIVIVLTLGDTGRTNLVLCGLIVFAVPIIDTSLAIVRRKLAGQSISSADDNHLHHILKRLMGVKGAVSVLYLMGGAFGVLGVAMQATKSRFVYALVLVAASFIGVIALKSARRKQIEEQMLAKTGPVKAVVGGEGAGALASVAPMPTGSLPPPVQAPVQTKA